MSEDEGVVGDRSARGFAASQQTGDELPPMGGRPGTGQDMDDPSAGDTLDSDNTDPVNTAAGFSVGGTGAGIEPGVDAEYGATRDNRSMTADVYGESGADQDFDPDADALGMSDDPDGMITG